MKHLLLLTLTALLLLTACNKSAEQSEQTEQNVEQAPALTAGEQAAVDVVNAAADSLAKDAPGALAAINGGTHPFSHGNQVMYSFVYDTSATMMAHPNPALVGQNLADKPDAHGKLFRRDIVQVAIEAGSGWTTYVYKEPGGESLHDKKTYSKLVTGSDGKQYVVCAGAYED